MFVENRFLPVPTVLEPPNCVTLYAVSGAIFTVFGTLDTLGACALLAGAGVSPCVAAVLLTEVIGALAIGKALEDRVALVLEGSSSDGSAAAAHRCRHRFTVPLYTGWIHTSVPILTE